MSPVTRAVVDATRLTPHLYQGGRPPIGSLVQEAGFRVLVLCAMEYQPDSSLFPGVRVVYAPLDDAVLTEDEWVTANRAAEHLAFVISGHNVKALVTCQQGRNRSGLVNALTLHRLTGMPGAQCVAYIRQRRRDALLNPTFVRALEGLRAIA